MTTSVAAALFAIVAVSSPRYFSTTPPEHVTWHVHVIVCVVRMKSEFVPPVSELTTLDASTSPGSFVNVTVIRFPGFSHATDPENATVTAVMVDSALIAVATAVESALYAIATVVSPRYENVHVPEQPSQVQSCDLESSRHVS